jgi:hypothetical protein
MGHLMLIGKYIIMTKYILTFESKKTIEWLEKIFQSMMAKAIENPSQFVDVAYELEDIKQALKNQTTKSDKQDLAKNQKEIYARRSKEKAYTPNLCPEHPTYSGQRVPTIDCEGHWAAYKKMNPMKYDMQRRKYERNKKTNSN